MRNTAEKLSLSSHETKLWLKKRARIIGSSEVAALFNKHPYLSLCGLWRLKRKKDIASPPIEAAAEKMFWGHLLEGTIARSIGRKEGWRIQKMGRKNHLLHPNIQGLGATLDWKIITDHEDPGIYEIKTMSQHSFFEQCIICCSDPIYRVELPEHFHYQLQTQMMVTGYTWGICAVLVGGQHSMIFEIKRDEIMIQKIEEAVTHFWQCIQAGISLCHCTDTVHS